LIAELVPCTDYASFSLDILARGVLFILYSYTLVAVAELSPYSEEAMLALLFTKNSGAKKAFKPILFPDVIDLIHSEKFCNSHARFCEPSYLVVGMFFA